MPTPTFPGLSPRRPLPPGRPSARTRSSVRMLCLAVLAAVAAGAACGPPSPILRRPGPEPALAHWMQPGPQSKVNAEMRALAKRLRAANPLDTIRAVYRWVFNHARRYSGNKSAVLRQRTAIELFRSRELSGCGDWGLLQAALLRAAGLPVVFVEAVSKTWAQRYRDGETSTQYEGHIFLEVHTPRGWVLVDSTMPHLYRNYHRGDPNLPRDHYVMARGLDPWDIGIKDEDSLHQAMREQANALDGAKVHECTLKAQSMLAEIMAVASRETVADLRERLSKSRIRGLAPRRFASWIRSCDPCRAVALLSTDTPAPARKRLLAFLAKHTQLPAWKDLPTATPRFVTWDKGVLCLYVRQPDALSQVVADLARRIKAASPDAPLDQQICLGTPPATRPATTPPVTTPRVKAARPHAAP